MRLGVRIDRRWVLGLAWRAVVTLVLYVLSKIIDSQVLELLGIASFVFTMAYLGGILRNNSNKILRPGESTVILESSEGRTAEVRTALQEYLKLDFSTAMRMTDQVPALVCEGVSKEDAGELAALLTRAGARVSVSSP